MSEFLNFNRRNLIVIAELLAALKDSRIRALLGKENEPLGEGPAGLAHFQKLNRLLQQNPPQADMELPLRFTRPVAFDRV